MNRFALALIAVTGFTANADIVRVDEFSSLQFEGFEDVSFEKKKDPVSIFDGMGEVLSTKRSKLNIAQSWSFRSKDWSAQTRAFEGRKMIGTTKGAIVYRFNEAQKSFGGMFATITDVPDATIEFYDGETLIGTDTLNAPLGGEWSWNGWSSDTAFSSVSVKSNYGKYGAFLMHDAVRVMDTPVPTPGSLAILAMGALVGVRRRR